MIKKFNIEGMRCAACSASIEKSVGKIDGVINAQVNLMAKILICEMSEDRSDEIIAIINSLGFSAVSYKDKKVKQNNTVSEESDTEMKSRVIISTVFLILLMYISMGHMAGLPLPHFLHGSSFALLNAFLQFILTLPVIYVNRRFFIKGYKALFKRIPNMDSLIAVGSSAALIYGIFSIFMMCCGFGSNNFTIVEAYASDLYFESAAMILTFVTIGKSLEEKSKNKTNAAITKLMDLSPKTATVIRNGKEVSLPAEKIVKGDILVIKPGETIPVDGKVTEGFSSVDESAVTGESIPIEKAVGDNVICASVNKNGFFKMVAEKVGEDTTLSQIIELIENANATKAPVARLADKIAGVFVPTVMILSLATVIVWLILGYSFDFALSLGISVLVISCPCALGLATPVAITVANGRCASKGILIKSAKILERLSSADTVIFDKTGTVTVGAPSVTRVICNNIEEIELLKIAGAIEKQSEHPLSLAIKEFIGDLEIPEVNNFEYLPGKGIRATIENNVIHTGNEKFMEELQVDTSAFENEISAFLDGGNTPMYFAENGKLIGIIFASDKIKPHAKENIEKLKSLGIDVILLTGDTKRTANAIGNSLNFSSVISQAMPKDKESVVSDLKNKGKSVVMVGDGINDSPALAAADVGISLQSGTDIANLSADIVLMRDDLSGVAGAISFSRRTMRIIKGNLFWAFFYNIIGIPIAAGIFFLPFGFTLSPMIASVCMTLSSLFVVTNSLRLYRK